MTTTLEAHLADTLGRLTQDREAAVAVLVQLVQEEADVVALRPIVTEAAFVELCQALELPHLVGDAVADLVAAGLACGDHDRPNPCQECR